MLQLHFICTDTLSDGSRLLECVFRVCLTASLRRPIVSIKRGRRLRRRLVLSFVMRRLMKACVAKFGGRNSKCSRFTHKNRIFEMVLYLVLPPFQQRWWKIQNVSDKPAHRRAQILHIIDRSPTPLVLVQSFTAALRLSPVRLHH